SRGTSQHPAVAEIGEHEFSCTVEQRMGAKVHVLVYKWTRVLFDLYCGYQNCRHACIGDWGSVEPKIEGPPIPVSVPLDNPFGDSGAMILDFGVRIRQDVLHGHARELIEGKPIVPLGLPVCCKETMVCSV